MNCKQQQKILKSGYVEFIPLVTLEFMEPDLRDKVRKRFFNNKVNTEEMILFEYKAEPRTYEFKDMNYLTKWCKDMAIDKEEYLRVSKINQELNLWLRELNLVEPNVILYNWEG